MPLFDGREIHLTKLFTRIYADQLSLSSFRVYKLAPASAGLEVHRMRLGGAWIIPYSVCSRLVRMHSPDVAAHAHQPSVVSTCLSLIYVKRALTIGVTL